MQTRKLGYTDLHFSVVGLGAWAMGGAGYKFSWGQQDDNDSIATIHRAIELGVNWVDTAAVYGLGHSEEVLGMAMNITDGRRVYMRNPVNDDAGPLYAYTAMPTGGLNRWYPREVYDRVEMGRYFTHTYNLPLYKIPVQGSAPRPQAGEPALINRHQLFDIIADPLQQSPLNDTALESHFAKRIAAHLRACEAPAEQYARLGLAPR